MSVRVRAWTPLVVVLALGATSCAQLEHKKDVRIDVSGPSEVEVGRRVTMAAATANGIVESYRWRSGDDAIAIVDRAGHVTGRRAGTVTVSAIGTVTDQTGKHRLTVTPRATPGTPDAGPRVDAGQHDGSVDAGRRDSGGPDASHADDSDAGDADAATDAALPDAGTTDAPSFAADVHPILMSHCSACHTPGGLAAGTTYVLVDDATMDRENVLDLINTANPESSRLLVKARGELSHGGGIQLLVTSPEYQTLRDWIAGGAAP